MPEAAGRPVVDDHFFFAPHSTGEALYAFTHQPMGPVRIGVVIVPPIGRERLRISQEIPTLGRDLAERGFPVIRFDYRGEGESGGPFAESTMISRVEDAVAAAAELTRRSGADRIALIGFHLGATIAVLAAARVRAEWLVLCDPVLKPQSYARNLLRASILQEGQYRRRLPVSEPDLRATLRAGHAINVFGFSVTAPLIDELEALHLEKPLREFPGHSTITYFASRCEPPPRDVADSATLLGAPDRCAVQPISMNFSWGTRKRWRRGLCPLNDAILTWLQNQDSGRGSIQPIPVRSGR